MIGKNFPKIIIIIITTPLVSTAVSDLRSHFAEVLSAAPLRLVMWRSTWHTPQMTLGRHTFMNFLFFLAELDWSFIFVPDEASHCIYGEVVKEY